MCYIFPPIKKACLKFKHNFSRQWWKSKMIFNVKVSTSNFNLNLWGFLFHQSPIILAVQKNKTNKKRYAIGCCKLLFIIFKCIIIIINRQVCSANNVNSLINPMSRTFTGNNFILRCKIRWIQSFSKCVWHYYLFR